jgi:hypothetical protein
MTSIKRADLAGFDDALQAGETEFVKRRIYLTLERGRDVVIRNVLRKVFIVGGYDPPKDGQTDAERVRRTRVPVVEFVAAMRLSLGQRNGEAVDRDEVECMIANMIYKVCGYPLDVLCVCCHAWQKCRLTKCDLRVLDSQPFLHWDN